MRRLITGQAAAKGLALGRARVCEAHGLDISEERIEEDRIDDELARLHLAIDRARDELAKLRDRLHGAIAQEIGEFLDLHAMLLDDPELLAGFDRLIRDEGYSAAYALKLQRDRLVAVFDGMDDPYLRSRREDIDHVIGRVHAGLQRRDSDAMEGLAGDVLICDSVAPSEIAQLAERGVVAIVTAQGSPLSHSAILARSLHVPLVVGAHDALGQVNDGDAMMVDGRSGEVIVEPSAADLRRFRQRKRESQREQERLALLKKKATRTKDGVDIRLFANAESREDVAQAHDLGAAGIGLYRTEFLFLQRSELPDEEEQFRVYRDVVLGMRGRPVTIRSLDLGADKADKTGLALASEPNPALGLRGVRLSLRHVDAMRTQLRAVLRASGYGPIRLLVPMISSRDEIRRVRREFLDCARDLRTEGYEIADNLELGAMIEVPAAALALPRMIGDVEFLSIGTNDLVQYLLAVDRNNDALGDLYSPLHPAVLRLLHDVIKLGQKHAKRVLVCGEMAADPAQTRLLLALGLTDFSLHPGSMLEVRQIIRESDHHTLRRRASALLRAPDREAIERAIARL